MFLQKTTRNIAPVTSLFSLSLPPLQASDQCHDFIILTDDVSTG